jgi:hypothetical protein
VLGTASALALSVALLPTANATPKPDSESASSSVIISPTFGTATIDGNASEWNQKDFAVPMCTAGSVSHDTNTMMTTCNGNGKVNLSDLFLRYDCNKDILYVLVLKKTDYEAERSEDDAWVTVGGNSEKKVKGNSGKDGTPPDFAWVESDGELLGYEASFKLEPGTHHDVEVHLNVSGNTSSTGKTNKGGKISIKVPATCEMPPVEDEPPLDVDKPQGNDEPPLLATDVDLTATLNDTGGVNLTLSTSAEPNTAALLILRGKKLDNGGTKIDVACEFHSGASPYTCTNDVVADTYRVAEIEYDGSLILYDEVTAE